MEKRIVLSNEHMRVEISSLGAELKSIKKAGIELLWQGDTKFWGRSAPILFPICGSLRSGSFRYSGKEYYLKQHGYASDCEFEAEKDGSAKAVFCLRSNDASLKHYPFRYELRVKYELVGTSIYIEYEIKNLSDHDMFFSIGAHEGWYTPGGIEDHIIEFEKDEELIHTVLDGALITTDTIKVGKGSIKLDYDYFTKDALVFLKLRSRRATLRNIKTGACIRVNFNGFDTLLLWTVPKAEFICIEPWCGMPDHNDFRGDISEKAGIIKLSPHKSCTRTHSIEFI